MTQVLVPLSELPDNLSWSFGGGTALSLFLDHRISYDIDIFFTDTEALRLLSPQRNKAVRAIAAKWQEPGNYIKLELAAGEIDFLVARRFFDDAILPMAIGSDVVAVEKPAEILAKKLHYRGSAFTVRDIFDLACVADKEPEALRAVVALLPQPAVRALDRTKLLATRYASEVWNDINPTEYGSEIAPRGFDLAVAALEMLLKSAHPPGR